ncbi:MAG: serine hydrolase domain-containing protein [Acidobacteriota bacterium]
MNLLCSSYRLPHFLLCAALLSLNAFAQAPNNPKVDAIFAAYDKPDVPGCALGVIKDGQLIYARGYGMANLEHGIPNGPKLVYDIGSTSKQFAAASILLLQQQGKLSLSDDIRKFVPEMHASPQTVTIRHLIHHTSGLRDYLTLFSLAGVNFDDTTTENDALQLIARQRELNFPPGEQWLYSNSGYFLLSIIVKRASGKSLAEFAREHIFTPLGMKDTLILDNHKRIIPRRATGYSPGRNGFQTEMSNFEQTGDGAVQTSIEDLLRWDQNFYDPKVGGPEFLKQMQEVGSLNNGEKLSYASGLFIGEYKGLRMVSHGGSWAGYRAELARFPEQKLSVACLCNSAATNPTLLAQRVAEVYLADQLKTPPTSAATANKPTAISLTEAQLQDKVGLYRSASSGELLRISLRDGKLRFDPFTPNNFELSPVSADRFLVVAPGQINELIFDTSQPQQKRLTVKRTGLGTDVLEAVPSATLTPEQLKAYVGSYYSEELDTTYLVNIENGQLAISHTSGLKWLVLPTFPDGFTTSSGMRFNFTRDAQKRVLSFAVQAGRTRNLRFAKQ